MKISRRGLAGVAAGAMAATQMDKSQASQQIYTPKAAYPYDEPQTTLSIKQDPQYWSNQVKHCKKILSGDFSDVMYQFEDNRRGRMYGDIEALKSISATARQTFIENEANRRKRRELIENARKQLDSILGMPFSVTGILFDE